METIYIAQELLIRAVLPIFPSKHIVKIFQAPGLGVGVGCSLSIQDILDLWCFMLGLFQQGQLYQQLSQLCLYLLSLRHKVVFHILVR